MTRSFGADDPDPIKAKLDKAREAYQAARDKNRDYLIDVLTQQAEAARKAGKVDLVAKVTRAVEDYKKGGPLPRGLAPNVKQRFTAARADMERAFALAAAEATKAKKDALVAAIKEEREKFLLDASDDPTVVRLMAKHSDKYVTSDEAEGETEARQDSEKPGNAQFFRMHTAANGVVMFSSLDGKRWLGTLKAGAAQETHISMAPRRTGTAIAAQQWAVQPLPEGYVRLIHRPSGKVLSVLGRSRGDGAALVIWTSEKDVTAQDWKFD